MNGSPDRGYAGWSQRRSVLFGLVSLVLGGAAGWIATAPPRLQVETLLHEAPRQPAPAPDTTPPEVRPGAGPRFEDVAVEAAVDLVRETGPSAPVRLEDLTGAGVCLLDLDLDDDLDLYFAGGSRLYRNDGGWRFTDVTEQAGVGGAGRGQGCCSGDYDLDGDLDLHLTRVGPDVLYRNEGDGTFSDVSARAGVADEGWGQGCAFLDHDRDGWPDLYVVNYLELPAASAEAGHPLAPAATRRGAPDRLYQNQRDGTFRDVTRESGVFRPDGRGMGLARADLDDDGYTDLFVANDGMENHLFLGRPGGELEEVGLVAGVAFSGSGSAKRSRGVDAGDIDGDGDVDLLVASEAGEGLTFHRNEGRGRFSDASVPAGLAPLTSAASGFSVNLLDHDSDGHLDVFVACGGLPGKKRLPPGGGRVEELRMRALLLANDGTGRFRDLSPSAGAYFLEQRIGRGAAVGDLDGDGDIDMVVSHLAGRPALLRNDTSQGHWIVISVRDAEGRREPPRVELLLEAGNLRHRRVLPAGGGYCSESDRRLHFGLGDSTQIDRLDVTWPDGSRDGTQGFPVDKYYLQFPRAFLRTPRGVPSRRRRGARGHVTISA